MTSGSQQRAAPWGTVAVGVAAAFGILITAGIIAVVLAGALQWQLNLSSGAQTVISLVVLVLGLLLAGRVCADIAGTRGIWCATGAAMLVVLIGFWLSIASEAHGDAIEPGQVAVVAAVVLIVSGGTSMLLSRRRGRR